MRIFFSLAIIMLSFLPALTAGAQEKTSGLEGLEWRFAGPYRGGRVNAVVGHPNNPLIFYAGYTGGGVWRTADAGNSWKNLSDGFFKLGSIGALDISRSNPDILYVGTGEHALRGDVSHGDGVYKTTDGGKTWTNAGLGKTRQISKLIIHPENPDIVYVAALGHFAGPNKERGVFKTIDGGKSWKNILFTGEGVGAVDLELDPFDSKTLYAAMWDVQRFPWGIRSGGAKSGLYKTTNGGGNWIDLSAKGGLPKGIVERIGIGVSGGRKDRIWATISGESDKGIFRSDDGGKSWLRTANHSKLMPRVYYFNHMTADPVNADRLYLVNYGLWRSDDGGKTYRDIKTYHPDYHALWIDPKNNDRIIAGSDGGASISLNGGKTWSPINNQPTGQFYTVTLDDEYPYNIYGSQQDWSTLKIPSSQRSTRAGPFNYFDTTYSEAGHTAIRKSEPGVLYISDHHWLIRYNQADDSVKYVGPRDETNYGWGTADIKYRFDWTFPVIASTHGKEALYVGSQYLHKSTDGGDSWKVISPDLTRADPETMEVTPLPGRDTSMNGPYWGPLTRDSNGDNWSSVIYTIEESSLKAGLIWTGSDDGRVFVTRNDGGDWDNVTPADLPDYAMVTRIAASSHDPAVAYFSASAYMVDNYETLLYRTDNFGKSWTRITKGLPEGTIMRSVRPDPVRKGLVFAGSEASVFVSYDDGLNWEKFAEGLPAVPVYGMKIKHDDLVIATHGRGFWIFDNLSVLRQQADQKRLYKPENAVRQSGRWIESQSASAGVEVFYNLAKRSHVSLSFLEETGKEIITFEQEAKAGLNKFVWNMHYPTAIRVPGVMTRGNQNISPRAALGKYRVKLRAGDNIYTEDFNIIQDPRSDATPEDIKAQFKFQMDILKQVNRLNNVVLKIRNEKQAIGQAQYSGKRKIAAEKLSGALTAVESRIVQLKAHARKDLHANPVMLNDKFYRLANFNARGQYAPTRTQLGLLDEFSDIADQLMAEYNRVMETEYMAYKRLLNN